MVLVPRMTSVIGMFERRERLHHGSALPGMLHGPAIPLRENRSCAGDLNYWDCSADIPSRAEQPAGLLRLADGIGRGKSADCVYD